MSQKSGSTVRPVIAELKDAKDKMAAEMVAMKQMMHDQLANHTWAAPVAYYEKIWMAGASEVTSVPVLLLEATACLVLVQCWDQEVT